MLTDITVMGSNFLNFCLDHIPQQLLSAEISKLKYRPSRKEEQHLVIWLPR